VKKENEVSDIDSQIRDFLDKKLTYFYKDEEGNKFAEVHTDVLYSYCAVADKNIPPLG
jgi:hypothetical protein